MTVLIPGQFLLFEKTFLKFYPHFRLTAVTDNAKTLITRDTFIAPTRATNRDMGVSAPPA
jgi:hypothetical protein